MSAPYEVDACCALIPVVKLADKLGIYDSEQAALSRAIERQIKRDKERKLGPGESGKSTFLKQMRIIHGAGYDRKDRLQFAATVFQNIYAIMQSLIHAMELLEIDYADAQSQESAELLRSVNADIVTNLEADHVSMIADLWKDAGIREAFARRREYQLTDSAQ